MNLCYTTNGNMLLKVVEFECYSVIIKYNMKEAFYNILVLQQFEWLFEFCLKLYFYTKPVKLLNSQSCLLSSKCLQKLFIRSSSYFWAKFRALFGHFEALLPRIKVTLNQIRIKSNDYCRPTDIFGISWQETKNLEETVVSVFGIKMDTNLFTLSCLYNTLNQKSGLILKRKINR